MTDINKFKLHPEVYLYNETKLVKIYTPMVYLEDTTLFWVYELATKEVLLVDFKYIKLAPKPYQVLYAGEIGD